MDEKFEIRDKRRIDDEGNVKEKSAGPARPEQERKKKDETTAKRAPGPEAPRREKPAAEPRTEEALVTFLMNLSAMAYMAMGLGEVPTKPNLAEARYIIDVLGVLEKKTAGNLSGEEERALKGLLYELRMNFAKAASGAGAKG